MTNSNDPAYPTMEHGTDRVGLPCITTVPGLTKREYFAALAMKGLIAGKWACPDNVPADPHIIASQAVAHAAALINELNKTDGNC